MGIFNPPDSKFLTPRFFLLGNSLGDASGLYSIQRRSREEMRLLLSRLVTAPSSFALAANAKKLKLADDKISTEFVGKTAVACGIKINVAAGACGV